MVSGRRRKGVVESRMVEERGVERRECGDWVWRVRETEIDRRVKLRESSGGENGKERAFGERRAGL